MPWDVAAVFGAHPVGLELREVHLAVAAGVKLRHCGVQLRVAECGAHHLNQRPHLVAIQLA